MKFLKENLVLFLVFSFCVAVFYAEDFNNKAKKLEVIENVD